MKLILIFFTLISTLYAENLSVQYLENNSQVKNASDSIAQPLTKDTKLTNGSQIIVGQKSTIDLAFGKENIVRLAPNTQIKVISNKEDNIELEIKKGEIWGNVNNIKDKTFNIKTDVAQMAIKGTIFAIAKNENSKIKVYRGTVECKNLVSGQVDVMEKGTQIEFTPVGMVANKGKIDLTSNEEKSPWVQYNNKKDKILLASIELKKDEEKNEKSVETKKQEETNSNNSNSVSKQATNNATQPPKKEETEDNTKEKQSTTTVQTNNQSNSENSSEEENKGNDNSSNDKFQMGAGYSLVTVDGKQYQRLNLTPEIPIWRFGIALDIELFIDDSGNFSSYGWDFSSSQKTMETLFRKIYYIRFNHPEDKFYFRLGAIDNFTLGYGIAMAGFNNVQLYPATKELGLVLNLNNISPLKVSLQTMTNDLSQIKDNRFIYAARLGFAPLGMTNIPLLNNLKISGFIAGDQNVYAGLKDRDGDGVPDELDAKPDDKDWAIDANLGVWQTEINDVLKTKFEQNNIDSVTAQKLLLTSADIDTAEKNMNKKYASQFSDLEDRFAIIGGDIGLPIINTSALKLDIYSQYATNLDSDNKSNKVEGYGIGAPGASLQLLIFNAMAEFRHYKGFFESNYFNSLYEINRAWVNPTTRKIVLKQYQMDSLDMNGFYSHAGANILSFLDLNAGYEYGTGTINGKTATYQKLYGEAAIGKKLIDIIPKLSEAKAFWQKDKYIPEQENFFDNTIDTKYGYIVGVEIGGSAVFQYQTLYYFEQNGPKRTDVTQKRQQFIGVAAKF